MNGTIRNLLAGIAFVAILPVQSLPSVAEGVKALKLPPAEVTELMAIPRKTVEVNGQAISYLEIGGGEPVVFLHGNPTSSYLWRNVMPLIADSARAIAPDLIGMGASAKPDIAYTFADHYGYVAGFIDALGLDRVTLVGHDWGAALAWEYARLNPERVARLAFMEGVLPPGLPASSFDAMGEVAGPMFRAFKDPVQGVKMVIDENFFVEKVLPGFVIRPLGETAMAAYRAPFAKPEHRKPVLAWPRQVPIAGEPVEMVETLAAIEEFMAETKMPVLLIYAEPGALVPPSAVPWYVEKIADVETAFVGQGFHFVQEDQPVAIGRAIADWIRRN